MKRFKWRALNVMSALAFTTAFSILGNLCRTWFYEPKVPQKILDMDN